MKILGKIKGSEIVLDKTDGAQALKLVDALPDAPGEGDSHSVQLRVNVGSYKRGDIFVYENDRWRKVVIPSATVGSVSSIICPRVNQDVQIRWSDPEDEDPYTWKHTRLMRKYGAYPQDIYDGIIVVDSYVRNQYRETMFHDYVPAGTEGDWYYKFFTFTEDEVAYSDERCEFQPIELSWSTINKIVQDGLATKVFALGDTVTVPPKEAFKTDPFYKDLKFVVAGFNTSIMDDTTKVYSIAFVLLHTFGNYMTHWDSKWAEYVLTADGYVTDPSKVYYIKDELKGWVEVTNLPIGKKLEENTYYEKNTDTDRQVNGGNKWANSALRTWMNTTNSDHTSRWTFMDSDGNTIAVAPPKVAIADEVLNAIVSVRNRNANPVGADRASADYTMSVDDFYLLSMKEVFDQDAIYTMYPLTTDERPCKYTITEDLTRNTEKQYFRYSDAKGVYRPTEDTDFNEDGSFIQGTEYYELAYYISNGEAEPTYHIALASEYTSSFDFRDDLTYYERKVSDIAENTYLPYFDDPDLNPRVMKNNYGSGTAQSWWLRSANILYTVRSRYVSTTGELKDGSLSYWDNSDPEEYPDEVKARHHIVFGFTVA